MKRTQRRPKVRTCRSNYTARLTSVDRAALNPQRPMPRSGSAFPPRRKYSASRTPVQATTKRITRDKSLRLTRTRLGPSNRITHTKKENKDDPACSLHPLLGLHLPSSSPGPPASASPLGAGVSYTWSSWLQLNGAWGRPNSPDRLAEGPKDAKFRELIGNR